MFNVLDSFVAPVTSSVLDSVAAAELRLLNIVPPASSVPATTVLPVLPATVNLFDWIASDPSDPTPPTYPHCADPDVRLPHPACSTALSPANTQRAFKRCPAQSHQECLTLSPVPV